MAFRGWETRKITLQNGIRVDAICPIIISASRATDIPAFYSSWFSNRLQAGYIRWTNPFNANQIQYVSFQNTRVIIFWSKNPQPLIKHLPEIDAKGINYYIQFTLNDYENENLEPNVPPLQQRVDTFKILAESLGKKRVIWRYDPLILTDSLTVEILLDRISRIANMLRGYTEKLVFSFADINIYKKVQNNLAREHVDCHEFTKSSMLEFAEGISKRNKEWDLKIATCAEGIDLDSFGIAHNRCIDDDLMADLFRDDALLMDFLGYESNLFKDSSRPYLKDKGQRKECGCIVSKDIGSYDTCLHLCKYCYANTSSKAVNNNLRKHNPESETILS